MIGRRGRIIALAALAAASLLSAGAADGPRTDVLSREPWRFEAATGQVIRTTHYRVYTTETNTVLTNRLASFLEHALHRYRTAFGDLPAPQRRLDTYLMDSRPQWESVTRRLMGAEADRIMRIQRGGYASRGIGVYYDLGLFDTLAIASHEGWHQYTQRVTEDRNGAPLPVWLEEGVATFMEGYGWERDTPVFNAWSNVERYDQLRRTHARGALIPLDDLLTRRPQDFLDDGPGPGLLDYYAQLWAFVHFLNEGEGGRHRDALHRVVAEALDGTMRETLLNTVGPREARVALLRRTGPAVFDAYFTGDLGDVSDAYLAFIDELVRPGARTLIVDGKSPIAEAATDDERDDG